MSIYGRLCAKNNLDNIYSLKLGICTIGNNIAADVRIYKSNIKELQCIIEVDDSGLATILSKHIFPPTKVNEVPLLKNKKTILNDGDVLQIDDVEFVYRNETLGKGDQQELTKKKKLLKSNMFPFHTPQRRGSLNLISKSAKKPIMSNLARGIVKRRSSSISLPVASPIKKTDAASNLDWPSELLTTPVFPTTIHFSPTKSVTEDKSSAVTPGCVKQEQMKVETSLPRPSTSKKSFTLRDVSNSEGLNILEESQPSFFLESSVRQSVNLEARNSPVNKLTRPVEQANMDVQSTSTSTNLTFRNETPQSNRNSFIEDVFDEDDSLALTTDTSSFVYQSAHGSLSESNAKNVPLIEKVNISGVECISKSPPPRITTPTTPSKDTNLDTTFESVQSNNETTFLVDEEEMKPLFLSPEKMYPKSSMYFDNITISSEDETLEGTLLNETDASDMSVVAMSPQVRKSFNVAVRRPIHEVKNLRYSVCTSQVNRTPLLKNASKTPKSVQKDLRTLNLLTSTPVRASPSLQGVKELMQTPVVQETVTASQENNLFDKNDTESLENVDVDNLIVVGNEVGELPELCDNQMELNFLDVHEEVVTNEAQDNEITNISSETQERFSTLNKSSEKLEDFPEEATPHKEIQSSATRKSTRNISTIHKLSSKSLYNEELFHKEIETPDKATVGYEIPEIRIISSTPETSQLPSSPRVYGSSRRNVTGNSRNSTSGCSTSTPIQLSRKASMTPVGKILVTIQKQDIITPKANTSKLANPVATPELRKSTRKIIATPKVLASSLKSARKSSAKKIIATPQSTSMSLNTTQIVEPQKSDSSGKIMATPQSFSMSLNKTQILESQESLSDLSVHQEVPETLASPTKSLQQISTTPNAASLTSSIRKSARKIVATPQSTPMSLNRTQILEAQETLTDLSVHQEVSETPSLTSPTKSTRKHSSDKIMATPQSFSTSLNKTQILESQESLSDLSVHQEVSETSSLASPTKSLQQISTTPNVASLTSSIRKSARKIVATPQSTPMSLNRTQILEAQETLSDLSVHQEVSETPSLASPTKSTGKLSPCKIIATPQSTSTNLDKTQNLESQESPSGLLDHQEFLSPNLESLISSIKKSAEITPQSSPVCLNETQILAFQESLSDLSLQQTSTTPNVSSLTSSIRKSFARKIAATPQSTSISLNRSQILESQASPSNVSVQQVPTTPSVSSLRNSIRKSFATKIVGTPQSTQKSLSDSSLQQVSTTPTVSSLTNSIRKSFARKIAATPQSPPRSPNKTQILESQESSSNLSVHQEVSKTPSQASPAKSTRRSSAIKLIETPQNTSASLAKTNIFECQNSPDISSIKQVSATPRTPKTVSIEELQALMETPGLRKSARKLNSTSKSFKRESPNRSLMKNVSILENESELDGKSSPDIFVESTSDEIKSFEELQDDFSSSESSPNAVAEIETSPTAVEEIETSPTAVEEMETAVEEMETPVEEMETAVEEMETAVEEIETLSTLAEEIETLVNVVEEIATLPSAVEECKTSLSSVEEFKEIKTKPKNTSAKVQKSPKNDLSNITGVKKLFTTPKVHKSPNNDLTDVRGMKKILATPKVQKEPKNDLTKIIGVKKLMMTPKVPNSPMNDLTDIRGVKQILKTPKLQKGPNNDLTNVDGVKKLLSTPKLVKSPLNDLTEIVGVKKLMTTPKPIKSPINDLSDVKGVKKLMATPKQRNSPKNDLSDMDGVNDIFKSPRINPTPEKKLQEIVEEQPSVKKTLKQPKSPRNELEDSSDVADLFGTPIVQKSIKNYLIGGQGSHEPKGNMSEVADLNDSDNLFDSLVEKKPVKTYSRKSSLLNKSTDSVTAQTVTNDSLLNKSNNLTTAQTVTLNVPNISPEVVKWVNTQEFHNSTVLSEIHDDMYAKNTSTPIEPIRKKPNNKSSTPLNKNDARGILKELNVTAQDVVIQTPDFNEDRLRKVKFNLEEGLLRRSKRTPRTPIKITDGFVLTIPKLGDISNSKLESNTEKIEEKENGKMVKTKPEDQRKVEGNTDESDTVKPPSYKRGQKVQTKESSEKISKRAKIDSDTVSEEEQASTRVRSRRGGNKEALNNDGSTSNESAPKRGGKRGNKKAFDEKINNSSEEVEDIVTNKRTRRNAVKSESDEQNKVVKNPRKRAVKETTENNEKADTSLIQKNSKKNRTNKAVDESVESIKEPTPRTTRKRGLKISPLAESTTAKKGIKQKIQKVEETTEEESDASVKTTRRGRPKTKVNEGESLENKRGKRKADENDSKNKSGGKKPILVSEEESDASIITTRRGGAKAKETQKESVQNKTGKRKLAQAEDKESVKKKKLDNDDGKNPVLISEEESDVSVRATPRGGAKTKESINQDEPLQNKRSKRKPATTKAKESDKKRKLADDDFTKVPVVVIEELKSKAKTAGKKKGKAAEKAVEDQSFKNSISEDAPVLNKRTTRRVAKKNEKPANSIIELSDTEHSIVKPKRGQKNKIEIVSEKTEEEPPTTKRTLRGKQAKIAEENIEATEKKQSKTKRVNKATKIHTTDEESSNESSVKETRSKKSSKRNIVEEEPPIVRKSARTRK